MGEIILKNEDIVITFVKFKLQYQSHLNRYFKSIYGKTVYDLYGRNNEVYCIDEKLLNWYFGSARRIFSNIENKLLDNTIDDKQCIQIINVMQGLLKLFDDTWKKEDDSRLQDIYQLILDTPLILLKRVGQILK